MALRGGTKLLHFCWACGRGVVAQGSRGKGGRRRLMQRGGGERRGERGGVVGKGLPSEVEESGSCIVVEDGEWALVQWRGGRGG